MGKNNNGFTLIELLVTITIMALFLGMALASHNNFASEKRTSSEAQKFADVLELARKKAFVADQSVPCGEFLGFSVVVAASTYELRSRCTLGGSALVQAYRFSASFQSTTPQTISFDSLTGKSSNSCVSIRNISADQCYRVRVTQAGSITSNKCSSCGTCC